MDVLINNLNHLDYFLKSYDEEKRFATLKRLGDAMLFFASSSIDHGRLKEIKAEKFLNSNMEKRTTAILILAEYLQSLQNTAHGIEYLKMARALLRQCLGTNEAQVIVYFEARSYHENEILGFWHTDSWHIGSRYPKSCSLRNYTIPDSTYELIKKRLQSIDTILKQTDSSFSPKWHESVKAVAQLFAIIIGVYAIIHFFGSNISHFVLNHKDLSFRMVQLVGFSIIGFFIYAVLRVFYTLLTSYGFLDKELNKSKELFKSLYTNHS